MRFRERGIEQQRLWGCSTRSRHCLMSGAPAENHDRHPIEAYSYVREWKCRVQFARLFVAALRQFERLGRDLRSEVAGLQVCLIGRKIRLIATVGDSDCQLAAYHTRATA